MSSCLGTEKIGQTNVHELACKCLGSCKAMYSEKYELSFEKKAPFIILFVL